MARSRNIKPGFFKNEELAALSPLARLTFAGLWTLADREGRLEDRPKRIKIELLPYDDIEIEKVLSELAEGGFIRRYEVGDGRFIDIPNFLKHQNPHTKEPESEIPEFQEAPSKPRKARARTGQDTENPEPARLIPSSPHPDSLNRIPSVSPSGSGEPPLVKPEKPLTPQAEIVQRFKTVYEKESGHSYDDTKADYVIAAELIAKHGIDQVVARSRTLYLHCRDGTVWFAEGGWGSFTLKKLKQHWNEILPAKDKEQSGFMAELKKAEANRARTDATVNRV